MNLLTANLPEDYTVTQVGGVGDRCWGISRTRPGVSMSEAILRMRVVYPHAHRTVHTDMLRGYLGIQTTAQNSSST
jgi:hypothetical protein